MRGMFVGYEDYGKTLLQLTGDINEPERITIDKATDAVQWHGYEYKSGWVFVGDKKENIPLAEIYRRAIKNIIPLQGIKTDKYCFGSAAFRSWAQDILNGKFVEMTADKFDPWCDYTDYVCVLATNSSCCHEFLKRAQKLNPDMTFLEEVSSLYLRMKRMWNDNNGEDLEAIGGGFNITLEALQNKEQCSKIAAKILECADAMDEIVRVLTEGTAVL
ncbi:MAG: hypothetical protein GX164_07690 [Clostridiales bacterium]|jgi:hypothetical protein|nr:hypothetical protein [Clostridiales bacterium]